MSATSKPLGKSSGISILKPSLKTQIGVSIHQNRHPLIRQNAFFANGVLGRRADAASTAAGGRDLLQFSRPAPPPPIAGRPEAQRKEARDWNR
jgi:hypothetical protein